MQATKKNSKISYLIIGSGRVARHLCHYFYILNISYDSWDRSQDPLIVQVKIAKATHVLLAISDDAIEPFYRKHLQGHERTVIHFSGALEVDGLASAHPLMTFGDSYYDSDAYKKIYFIVTSVGSVQELIPCLPNPSVAIPAKDKAKYHALCVLGGNFVTLLITKMLQEFSQMGIPKEAAEIYLEKVLGNTLNSPETAVTGPLVRRDAQTVLSNLRALDLDPHANIYRAFLNAYWPSYPRK
jgi:predicted short-subunit dehydrogenase-like oxidoreductase (DUF2520 family)